MQYARNGTGRQSWENKKRGVEREGEGATQRTHARMWVRGRDASRGRTRLGLAGCAS